MYYNYWRKDSQLYKASLEERPGFVVNDLSFSQPRQNYLPSAPEDPPPVVTQHRQHRTTHDGDLMSNDQRDIHIATGQPSHNTSFNHLHSPSSNDPFVNNLESPGDVSESNPIEGHPHPVHDNPSKSHTSSSLYVCKWNDGHGPCDMTLNEREMKNHIPSHLPRGSRLTLLRCQWEGCARQQPMRRDTIIRHIRQIELGISPRRQ